MLSDQGPVPVISNTELFVGRKVAVTFLLITSKELVDEEAVGK